MAVMSYYSNNWCINSTNMINYQNLYHKRKPIYNSSSSSSSSSSPLSRSSIEETVTQITNSGVIACLRANSSELAMEAACAALSGGISVLEIVMSTPGVFEVLRQLGKDHPAAILGVGTVLNKDDAESAVSAGAKFFMGPAIVKDILDDSALETLYIPGVMTPTEIIYAYDAGAKMVKIYPISVLGGVRYISALSRPFSHIPMVASQGITLDLIDEYIANGASAVVLSDAIFEKEAINQRNFNLIHKLSQLAAFRGKVAVQRKRSSSLG